MDHSLLIQALDTQTPELGERWMKGLPQPGEKTEVQGAGEKVFQGYPAPYDGVQIRSLHFKLSAGSLPAP